MSEGEKETSTEMPENIQTEDMRRHVDICQREDIQQGEASQQADIEQQKEQDAQVQLEDPQEEDIEQQGDIVEQGVAGEAVQKDISDIPKDKDIAGDDGTSQNENAAKADKGKATETNLADVTPSDDEDISQPSTPAGKVRRNIGATPQNFAIEAQKDVRVETPKNIAIKEEVYLNKEGYRISPKYAGGKHEGEARIQ